MDASTAFAAAWDAPVESMARTDLDTLVTRLRVVRSWCDAVEVRVARRARELDAALDDVVGRAGRQAAPQVRRVEAREQVCGLVPALEAALAAGDATAGHVDAVAAAVRDLDDAGRSRFASYEASLVRAAREQAVDAFARSTRELARQIVAEQLGDRAALEKLEAQRKQSRVRRWVDTDTGMHHTHVVLDPERDEKWWTAVRAQLGRLRQRDGNRGTPFRQLEVDAIVTAAGTGEQIPEIAVHIDWRSLLTGAHAHGLCETADGVPMPITTVRRLCCDAHVLPVVLGAQGEVLDLGRSMRTTNRAQRRALRAMHKTCGHPGCTVPFEACRIHHVRWWWEHRGPTDLANLLPLCEQHHHLVHEGGWSLTMTADRVATWVRPDGTEFHSGPTIDRAARPLIEPRARSAPVAVAS
jgi:hypothetical protein